MSDGDNDRARAARDFLADVETATDMIDRIEATGWLVICVDLESNDIVGAYGTFDTPEQALIEAGKHQATSLDEPGEAGWQHVVKPLYPPVKWRT